MATTENDTPVRNLPDFEPGTAYEVTMARAVEYPPSSGNWLRPDHRVTMDGAVALILKDEILGAGIAEAA